MNPLRSVRLLNAQPSAREMALQGLRVLTGSPTHPFQRALTRERIAPDSTETTVQYGDVVLRGTNLDVRDRPFDD
jgi:hypothetical protein